MVNGVDLQSIQVGQFSLRCVIMLAMSHGWRTFHCQKGWATIGSINGGYTISYEDVEAPGSVWSHEARVCKMGSWLSLSLFLLGSPSQ